MKPMVSICIPGYNCSSWIEQAITSAMKQDYSNVEILYVDNQSTDNSYQIAQKYRNEIRLYQNDSNIGMMANHNRALELAEGDYICFLGADDILRPNHVRDLAELLIHNSAAVMAIGEKQIVDENGTVHGCTPFYNHSATIPGIEQARVFMMSSMAYTCQVMLRCNAVHEVGGFPLQTLALEPMLWYKCALEGDVEYTQKVVAAYRVHPENMTADLSRGLDYAYENYTSYYQIIKHARQNPYLAQFCDAAYKNIGHHIMRAAQRIFEKGCYDTAKAYMHMALAYDPAIKNSYTYRVFQFCMESETEHNPMALYSRLKDTLPISAVRVKSYELPSGSVVKD